MALLSRSRFALDTRVATVALALILATVSLPLIGGWIVTDSQCALTMDICHPAQTIEVGLVTLFAPAPQSFFLLDAPREGILACDDCYRAQGDRLGDAPDPPPPKNLA